MKVCRKPKTNLASLKIIIIYYLKSTYFTYKCTKSVCQRRNKSIVSIIIYSLKICIFITLLRFNIRWILFSIHNMIKIDLLRIIRYSQVIFSYLIYKLIEYIILNFRHKVKTSYYTFIRHILLFTLIM